MTRTPSRSRTPLAALIAFALLGAGPAVAVKRRAFVTSVSGPGNLSAWPGGTGATSLDRADSICRARAVAAGLPNALAYRAWLSTSGTDAYCHVQGLGGTRANGCNGASQPGAGPWFLVNGITNFTAPLARLTGPEREIYRPVIFDEFGNQVAPSAHSIWTGTAPDGTALSLRCLDWTSAAHAEVGVGGSALSTVEEWSARAGHYCDANLRLLCLEPGTSEQVVLGWSPGALVFVTSQSGTGNLSSWPAAQGASGLDAGDEICRNLAAQSHLPSPESFVAWLSDSLVDAVDRVTVDGPFRRLDAYTLAGSKADLVDGALQTSIHVDENGTYRVWADPVWTGTHADGTQAPNHCLDWTATAGQKGRTGALAHSRDASWSESSDDSCGAAAHLYCVSNRVTLFWDGFESGDTGNWSVGVP